VRSTIALNKAEIARTHRRSRNDGKGANNVSQHNELATRFAGIDLTSNGWDRRSLRDCKRYYTWRLEQELRKPFAKQDAWLVEAYRGGIELAKIRLQHWHTTNKSK
jgi:hypothetical protein